MVETNGRNFRKLCHLGHLDNLRAVLLDFLGHGSVPCDFSLAFRWASAVLAAAARICPTYQFCYMAGIAFSLPDDKESNEEAASRWVSESGRYSG